MHAPDRLLNNAKPPVAARHGLSGAVRLWFERHNGRAERQHDFGFGPDVGSNIESEISGADECRIKPLMV